MYMVIVLTLIINGALGTKHTKHCGSEPSKPKCGYNEEYVKCKTICPPQSCDISYTEYLCSSNSTCEAGCDCIKDHLRNSSNICVPNDQCAPPKAHSYCGPNEVASNCKIACPPQSCESIYTSYACDASPCESGCDCIDGYLRDANGTCICSDQCPPAPSQPNCGPNEVASNCKIACPPQSCESIYTSYACDASPCESGCDCIDGYLRDANGTCIPNEQCPSAPPPLECGPNEVASDCKITCPPQYCTSLYSKFACEEKPCESGCNCIDGYMRDGNDVCIPTNKCPGVSNSLCGVNETYVDCAFRCPNQNCPADDSNNMVACKPGRPCPSGCACKDFYRRLSDDDDTCVLASDCPPVDCTRPNEVWDPCSSDCLVESCEDVNSQQSGCETQEGDCRPRCVCMKNHCRDKDNTCVPRPSEQCPGGSTNTSSNSTASSSSHTTSQLKSSSSSVKSSSSSKSSSEASSKSSSQSSGSSSKSSSQSSAESSSSKSSSHSSCESSSESNGTKGQFCEPTCADPNPNCQSESKDKSSGTKKTCQDGFILSKKGGKCIKIEDCPNGCKGDPNAVAKKCPSACPSTCDKPNALPCTKACLALGCQCTFGYLRAKNGTCVTPQECPGGTPCGKNENFVACKSGCPTDYCPKDDSRAIVACDPPPLEYCSSGCVCKLNHKRLSYTDDRCIVSSECPPVNCTRPNEEWNPCPSECQGEYCDSANKEPVTCNTLVLNCQPKCMCKKNHFRNTKNICIPAKQCPKTD